MTSHAAAQDHGSHANHTRKADKRKAEDDDSPQAQTHTRSKRSRYISIACNECKRRKIKCNGQDPCQRCGNLSLDCIYSPNCCTNALRDSAEFKEMHDQIAHLQEQVADLWNMITELRNQPPPFVPPEPIYSPADRPPAMPSMTITRTLPPLFSPNSSRPQRQLPSFHGPTSSTYGFDVAKSSLKNMGITQPPDEGLMSRERSQAASPVPLPPHPNKDPIWSIDEAEAMRLWKIYDEEIHCMYPILEVDAMLGHIKSLFKFLSAALKSGYGQLGLPGEDAMDDDQTTVLKLVLATALIVEGHGHSELGQKFYDSAVKSVNMIAVQPSSVRAIVLVILTATYHFQKDEETQAWRWIGMAGRISMEMGLHRKDSLMRSFPVQAEFQHAVRVFWVVYALDRRWSFGTGMPFSLQDSDIDPQLPEPDNMCPYLKHITAYNKIATQIWQHISAAESGTTPPREAISAIRYLDFQILEWYQNLPDILRFDHTNLVRESQVPDRKTRRLKFLMYLRKNQARTSVYRPILHSLTSIMQNKLQAEAVISIAKDTINTIIGVDRISDIYRTQQVCYNYFLVQALAVIFLAVAHAPAMFVNSTRQEFYGAIDLIKGFSTKAYTTRKLWKTVRGLKDLGHKIGQLSQYGLPNNAHTNNNADSAAAGSGGTGGGDAHSNAALAMAGLAGHKLDSFTPNPTSARMHRHNSMEMSYSPEDASQMGNELTALFEMAGAYGNGHGGVNGGIGAATPGMDGFGYPPPGVHGEAEGEYNAIFGNEPEFSRIMNELL